MTLNSKDFANTLMIVLPKTRTKRKFLQIFGSASLAKIQIGGMEFK